MDAEVHQQAVRRAELARGQLRCCNLCPHRCGVDRTAGQKGYCGLDDSVRCFREVLQFCEERELVPSHQIYFAGCNLRCGFCTVAEWNQQPGVAEELDIEQLKKKIVRRRLEGARTLNLLGGEPTVSLHGVIELLAHLDPVIRVVLNSNMYYNGTVDELMRGLVDIYLADLKCGDAGCAEALLGADDYVEVAKQNIVRACAHGEVIVRHIVLPGHSECCLRPIMEWVATEVPQVKLSLRGDYVPPAEASLSPRGYLKREDLQGAINLAEKMGLNLVR